MHLPSVPPLRRAAFAALSGVVMTSLLVGGLNPVAAGAPAAAEQAVTLPHVKIGLGCWESGGRYDITNPASGAYGRYQIMPTNWPSWARRYLGRSSARPTPANQELVTSGKLADLYHWLDTWQRVVYWWLTGSTTANQHRWSNVAHRYVSGVLSIARRSGTQAGRRTIPARCLSTPPKGPSGPGGHQPGGNAPHRIVTATVLNVRAGPGLSYRIIDGFHAGRNVSVLDLRTDSQGHPWIKVARSSGGTGWVARWWTRPAGGAAH